MPSMTFIMLRADYLCGKWIETCGAHESNWGLMRFWGGTGASRAEANE